MKQQVNSKTLFFPMPAVLIAAGRGDDIGLCTVAWAGLVSGTPPTIAVGLRDVRHTRALVEAAGEFTVNIPRAGMEAALDFCGIEAGGGAAKWIAGGLTPAAASAVGAPIVAECPMVLECRVAEVHEVGSYHVVFGEIVAVQADEDVLTPDGVVDVEALDPITYVPGLREYRALGRKLADAYSVGKPLKERME